MILIVLTAAHIEEYEVRDVSENNQSSEIYGIGQSEGGTLTSTPNANTTNTTNTTKTYNSSTTNTNDTNTNTVSNNT